MLKASLTVTATALFVLVSPTSILAQQLERSVAIDQVQALRVQQCAVQAAVRSLPSEPSPARDAAIQQLRETKTEMSARIAALEAQMAVAPELQAAANTIREARLVEKLDFSLGTIEHWDDGSENRLEAIIQGDLGTVGGALAPATTFECPAPA
jgi:hypothetical protein